MCNDCGCSVTSGSHLLLNGGVLRPIAPAQPHSPHTVAVLRNLLQENDQMAAHNRAHFKADGVRVFNLMSSPGSGKTALLEASVVALRQRGLRVGVIEGDLETENDALRLRRHGVPVVQITTGMACHLDAQMIHQAYAELPGPLDILFIENVGNLVCPASFDLGQDFHVVLLSVPEGDDKPEKYPVMFRQADKVLLSKIDLLPYFDEFEPARVRDTLGSLAAAGEVLALSVRTGEGLEAWLEWLTQAGR